MKGLITCPDAKLKSLDLIPKSLSQRLGRILSRKVDSIRFDFKITLAAVTETDSGSDQNQGGWFGNHTEMAQGREE